jgi:hypothetical protein
VFLGLLGRHPPAVLDTGASAGGNAAEATDEADDEKYFAVLDQAGNAAEAAAAEITGYKTYADLLEALDTRRKQSQDDEYGERRLHR